MRGWEFIVILDYECFSNENFMLWVWRIFGDLLVFIGVGR